MFWCNSEHLLPYFVSKVCCIVKKEYPYRGDCFLNALLVGLGKHVPSRQLLHNWKGQRPQVCLLHTMLSPIRNAMHFMILLAAAAGGDRWQKCSALCTTIRKYMMKYHQGDLNGCVFCFACALPWISNKNIITTMQWAFRKKLWSSFVKMEGLVGIPRGQSPIIIFLKGLTTFCFTSNQPGWKMEKKWGSGVHCTSKGKCIFIKLQLLKLSKKSWVSNIGGLMFLHRMAAQRHNMALKHYILEWYLILVPPKFFFSSLGPLSQSRQQMAAPGDIRCGLNRERRQCSHSRYNYLLWCMPTKK